MWLVVSYFSAHPACLASEGMPHPYDKKKKLVVPQALKVLRLKPERRFCRLGDLSKEVGWKQSDVLDRQRESRRMENRVDTFISATDPSLF